MDVLATVLKYALLACIFAAPLLVLSIKPDASARVKSARLIVPVILFAAIIVPVALHDCFLYWNLGCMAFKSLSAVFMILFYIMYIGWFEYIWQRIHKRLVWPPEKNFQDGAVSTCILVASRMMMWVFLLLFVVIALLKTGFSLL